MFALEITPNTLEVATIASIVGAFVSLVFTLFPKLNVKYAALTDAGKQWIMIGIGFLVVVLFGVVSCVTALKFATCDTVGFLHLLVIFTGYAVGNQAIHSIVPKPASVTLAKKQADAVRATAEYERRNNW